MAKFFKEIKPYQYFVWLILILATVLAIYTPEQFLFKKLSKYGVQLMITCLGLGLFFLTTRDTKSMWVSLACTGVLCLHLRTREPFYPIKYGTFFKIAHIDLSNSSDYEQTIKIIMDNNVDILSVQDLDPDWDFILKQQLSATYPYEKSILSLGLFNTAIYSKYPFIEIDTFYYKDAPNIHGCVEIDHQKVHFISSMTVPPVDMNAFQEIEKHLLNIAAYSTKINAPILTLGNYNVVPQSSEINGLKRNGGLYDSRTNQSLIAEGPVDHILYSKELECTDFTTLTEANNNKIGIMGTYQFNLKYVQASVNKPKN